MVKVRFLTKMSSFWKLMLLSIDIVEHTKILTSTGSYYVIGALQSEYLYLYLYFCLSIYVSIYLSIYILHKNPISKTFLSQFTLEETEQLRC